MKCNKINLLIDVHFQFVSKTTFNTILFKGFQQIDGIDTLRTKITCECEAEVCNWVSRKPFGNCIQAFI